MVSLELETMNGVIGRKVEIEMFLPIEGSDKHNKGRNNCTVGWCGNGYPKECVCGGLLHAYFGGEDNTGYWLNIKCDKCKEGHDEK